MAMSFGHRPLPGKILTVFHQACDEAEFEIADQLIRTAETLVRRSGYTRNKRAKESLAAAYQRLWDLRHGGDGSSE